MSDSNQASAAMAPVDPLAAFFSYRGRLGRAGYFLGIGLCFLVLLGALAAAAGMMNPTGGGAPFLILLLLPLYVWIHSLVTIKRLRDAGHSPWLYLVYGAGPFIWLAVTVEFTAASDALWFPVLAVFGGLYLAPGVLPPREPAPAGA